MKLTILSKPSGEIYSAMYGEYADQPDSLVIDFDENIELLFNEYMVFEGQLLHIGPRPTLFHFPDIATRGFVPNLDAARESKRQAWNAWRDRELVAGYVHEGHRFHTNDGFMGELHLLLKGHEEGLLTGTSSIRTMANEVLQKTGAEIKTLLLILGQHRQAIYQQSWVGKDALAGLTTLEDIVAGGPPS